MVSVLLWIARRRALILTVLIAAGVVLAILPFTRQAQEIPKKVESYLLRGQTRDDLAGASGRDELWARAIDSFRESPVLGSGYYMVSRSGTLFVWLKKQYQTAHSLYLHVLTGTGVVGAALFLWACTAAIGPSVRRLGKESEPADVLLLLLSGCFALIGFFELSILGPVDPTNVLFFATVGATVVPVSAPVLAGKLEAQLCVC